MNIISVEHWNSEDSSTQALIERDQTFSTLDIAYFYHNHLIAVYNNITHQ